MPLPSAMRIARCNVQYARAFKYRLIALSVPLVFGLGVPSASAQADQKTVIALAIDKLPRIHLRYDTPEDLSGLLSPTHLRQRIEQWLKRQAELGDKTVEAAVLSTYLNDVFLQSGYAFNAHVLADEQNLWVDIHQTPPLRVAAVKITGGSPQDRYITQRHLQLVVGEPFDREAFLEHLDWLRQNHFLPLQVRLEKTSPEGVDIHVNIPIGVAWIPTGNIAANSITGVSLTGGVIVDNPLGAGLVARASVKRNNLEPPFFSSTHEIQDWEYVLSLSSMQQAIPGMSVGMNHYNKVDYIYPGHGQDIDQMLWIRSTGVDLYSGFQLWEDLEAHRYLRGVFNVSLIEDRFFSRLDPTTYPQQQTQSGNSADILVLPSFTMSYSDIDDYRIPRNGNFLQGQISAGLGDATYSQATATGVSFWSPYVDDQGQWTLLVRSAAGTTFGQSPPFYRGFLNTGRWLVRGATQFSITEKHSLRFSEELHYVFRPSTIQVDQWMYELTKEIGSQGYADNWALDFNVFLDQGAYWRDSVAWQSAQLSLGTGVNLITPGGSILGLDFALPLYPQLDGISVLLRLSAPLNFTLYSDWFNSNGFFLR